MLREVGLAYVNFAVANAGAFRLMFDRVLKPFTAYEALASAAGQAFAELAGAVAQTLPDDAGDRARREVLTHALWSLVHGHTALLLAAQLGGPLGLDDASGSRSVSQAIACLVRGVRDAG